MSTVISVENISKQYRLGEVGTGTLKQDFNRWYHRIRGKEDPYLRIGERNDRTVKGKSDYVWALEDINFEVKQGEVLGIIGRNGAGKSTLLKILSKVTQPTTGQIKVKGRIASLLEVGTGFHPELSGRENIFLNGAILGMTKKEIARKFDEIVDFAGVERYIDTPVKRYSSGMYVRLAFGVAAHLEPEILIVDEVLAVGDAEFQKKCLGKMKDVSDREGRTVLFVSHNMGAVQQLCTKGLLIANGRLDEYGDTRQIIEKYISNGESTSSIEVFDSETTRTGTGIIKFCKIELMDSSGMSRCDFSLGEDMIVRLHVSTNERLEGLDLCIQIKSSDGMPIYHMMGRDSNFKVPIIQGKAVFDVRLNDLRLYPGNYSITPIIANTTGHEIHDLIDDAIIFGIIGGGSLTSRRLPRDIGLLFETPTWSIL